MASSHSGMGFLSISTQFFRCVLDFVFFFCFVLFCFCLFLFLCFVCLFCLFCFCFVLFCFVLFCFVLFFVCFCLFFVFYLFFNRHGKMPVAEKEERMGGGERKRTNRSDYQRHPRNKGNLIVLFPLGTRQFYPNNGMESQSQLDAYRKLHTTK